MTTHELAKKLLELPDIKVKHQYTHWDNFDDEPYTYLSEVEILTEDKEGVCYLSSGELIGVYEEN